MLLGELLAHSEYLEEAIARVTDAIGQALRPFARAVELVQTLPGLKAVAAAAIVAEIGAAMPIPAQYP